MLIKIDLEVKTKSYFLPGDKIIYCLDIAYSLPYLCPKAVGRINKAQPLFIAYGSVLSRYLA